MTVPRIHYPRKLAAGEIIELTDREIFNYLHNVMRLRSGEGLVLFGRKGVQYGARLLAYEAKGVRVEIIDAQEMPDQGGVRVTLAQSLPKGGKLDELIERATELGANRIIPFVSSRSVPRIEPRKLDTRLVRWRRIALEAARQCRRDDLPEIPGLLEFPEMLESAEPGELRLIFWEEEGGEDFQTIMREGPGRGAEGFFLVVGPEGGFSAAEVQSARARGFTAVTLGARVLKVETAAPAILAIIQYERGIFSVKC